MSSKFVSSESQLQLGGVICNPNGTIKRKIELTSSVPDASRRRFTPFPAVLRHDNDARNTIANALCDLFDVGSTNSQGRIRIYTEGGITLLATVLMANPAFTNAVNGVAPGFDLPWRDSLASGSGLAAEFIAINRDEDVVLTGNVAIAGGELNFPQLEIATNDIVKILSASYTAAP
jgi:hypothetical protein